MEKDFREQRGGKIIFHTNDGVLGRRDEEDNANTRDTI